MHAPKPVEPLGANTATTKSTIAAERQRRLTVINEVFGIWKDRADVPKDALQYQCEMRAEWR